MAGPRGMDFLTYEDGLNEGAVDERIRQVARLRESARLVRTFAPNYGLGATTQHAIAKHLEWEADQLEYEMREAKVS